jgi:hypothetical protein
MELVAQGSAHQRLDCARVDASDPRSQVRMKGGGLHEAREHTCMVMAVVFPSTHHPSTDYASTSSGENKHIGAISEAEGAGCQ